MVHRAISIQPVQFKQQSWTSLEKGNMKKQKSGNFSHLRRDRAPNAARNTVPVAGYAHLLLGGASSLTPAARAIIEAGEKARAMGAAQ
jgi:hypothetical protein